MDGWIEVEHLPKYATLAAFGVLSLYLIKRYFNGATCSSTTKLNGKLVIITGANTGIGLKTTCGLAKRGARVILACRDLGRANKAAKIVAEECGAPDRVSVRRLDLGSLTSVREFANGIIKGHFLLTMLLLDNIKAAAPSRIVIVSSLGHRTGKMHFDDLMLEKPGSYGRHKAYAQSKLANVLFTRELARRLKGSRVTANALHPGAVRTELARHIRFIDNFIFRSLVWFVTKSVERGAETSIYAAVATELEGVTGKYLDDCSISEPSKESQDDEAARKLWEISEELVGLK